MIKRVKRRIIIGKLVRNIVFFIISVSLVLVFWHHRRLFELGYELVVIAGSILVFLAIKLGSWLGSKHVILGRAKGTVLFQPGDINLVLYGTKRQLIRPYKDGEVKVGSIYEAKLALSRKSDESELQKEKPFAKILVEDVYAVLLKEITEQDATSAGFRSLEDFKEKWTSLYGEFKPDDVVRIIKFDVLEKK